MGLLDKILGRAKDTARDIGEQAAPLAGKAGAAVGGAVDKARDVVADHADDMKGAVEKATGFVDDKTGGKLTGALDKVETVTDRAVDAVAGSSADEVAPAAATAAQPEAPLADTPPASE
jgi:hypothetical protein